jgi:hypothetical protein
MKIKPRSVFEMAAEQWAARRPDAIPTLNRVGIVPADFHSKVEAIHNDPLLSSEGPAAATARAAAIKKAAVASAAALNAIDADTAKVTGRAEAIQKALLAKHAATLPRDVPFEALREIRDQLRELSPAERLNLYRSPNTDPLVLLAIETGPPGFGSTRGDGSRRFEPFVDPEELAAERMSRAEALDPTSAASMRELRDLAEIYRLATSSVRKEIADVAGATIPEAVQS